MKKLVLLSLILFPILSFSQSILIQPNKMESKQSSAIDNITLQATNQPNVLGKRHNGTLTTPTAVVDGDDLLSLQAAGHTGSAFTGVRSSIRFEATQNWTTTNNGSRIKFLNTPNGSTNLTERMVINQNGNVGIGVSTPTYKLELLQDTGSDDGIGLNRLGGDAPAFFGIGANGTASSPTATLSTNIIARYGARGHNGTGFTSSRGRIDFVASQNWSSTENGTDMKFYTTNNGSTSSNERMVIKGNGYVGIGQTDPQAKLDVGGDIILSTKSHTPAFANSDIVALDRDGKSVIRIIELNGNPTTVTLSGIAGGVDGMLLYIYNYQVVTLTIAHESATATSQNRIWTGDAGSNILFSGRGGAILVYDGLNSRWRVLSYNN
jgi:hypothetical protein